MSRKTPTDQNANRNTLTDENADGDTPDDQNGVPAIDTDEILDVDEVVEITPESLREKRDFLTEERNKIAILSGSGNVTQERAIQLMEDDAEFAARIKEIDAELDKLNPAKKSSRKAVVSDTKIVPRQGIDLVEMAIHQLVVIDRLYRKTPEFKALATTAVGKEALSVASKEERLEAMVADKDYMKFFLFISKAPPRESVAGKYCEKCHRRTVIKSKYQFRASDEGENEKYECYNPLCRNIIVR